MSKQLIPEKYELKKSGFLPVFSAIAADFFLALFILNIVDYFVGLNFITGSSLFASIVFFVFAVLCFGLFANAAVWKITVDGDEIKYRTPLGKITTYSFSDISEAQITVQNNAQAVKCLKDGKTLFVVPSAIKNYPTFMTNLFLKGVTVTDIRRG